MDLSKFSDADLKALQANNLTGLSNEGLRMLSSAQSAAPVAPETPATADQTKPYIGYPSAPRKERMTPIDPATRLEILKRDIWSPERVRMPTVGGAVEATAKGAAGGGVVGGPVGLVAGGLVGQPVAGGAAGLTTGTLLGGASGLAEYGLESAGFSPGLAQLASMATPTKWAITLAEKSAPAVEKLAQNLLNYVPGSKIARGLMQTAADSSAAKRVREAMIELVGGAPSLEAEQKVGQSMARGAAQAQAGARQVATETQAQIEARTARELEQERERVSRLRGRATGAQLMQEQSNAQKAAQASGLTTVPPSELGGEIQGRLVGRQAAIDTEMKQAYETRLKDFLDFARGEQRAGRFWKDSEAGKKAISDLESLLKPTEEMGPVKRLSSEEEAAVRKVLDEIKGTRKVTVTEPYPETKIVSEPVDVMVVDNVIRKLAEASKGRPAEGYEAIGVNLAKDMRNVLRTAMEDYSAPYGAAKESYREANKLLETYKEGPVAKVTQTSAKVRDRLRTDAQGVAESLFKSPQSVSDLTEALGDKQMVTDLGRQFVNNKLASFEGSVEKTENWLKNAKTQETLDALGLKGYGDKYLNDLKRFDTESGQFGRRAEALGKQVTPEKIISGRKAITTAEQKAIDAVRTKASDVEKRIADAANLGKTDVDRLESLLNRGDPSSIRRVGQMLDTEGKSAMPDAVRQYLSRTPGSKLTTNWDRTKRLLESGKLMSADEIAKLDKDVSRVITQMGQTPTKKQINQLAILISSRMAGALAGSTVEP
jgi:hypothetical protein